MKVEEYSTRTRERINLKIPVRVTGRENRVKSWSVSSFVEQATSCGIGFNLCRPIEPGRLLHLSLPMPRSLRAFDYFKTEYQVWGLVRYVLSKTCEEQSSYKFIIGVALVGQHAPMSYELDPTTLYDIKPVRSTNGLWTVRERPKFLKHYARETERHQFAKEVSIEVLNENGAVTQTGYGKTIDISQNGAAIQTQLQIPRGSFLRVTNNEISLTILSLTRSCRPAQDGINDLHVEFIDKDWTD